MKEFLGQDFLLDNPTAEALFHDVAAKAPIVDYHCHINPQEIAENRKFENITQVWLGGDHYKWRMMRSNGVDEKYITGDAPDREKFQKFAETLGRAIGHPVFQWSHLELRRYFGYDGVLNGDTAEEVWNLCNAKLQEDDMSVRSLIKRSNVRLICTTDDPVDDLKWHKMIRDDESFDVQVLPAWRPDKAMRIDKPEFPEYIKKLSEVSGVDIKTVDDLKKALDIRMKYFDDLGCLVSDHGVDIVMYRPGTEEEVEKAFEKRLAGEELTAKEADAYKTAFMMFVAGQYKKYGWVLQLHYGCKRDNNTRMYKLLGPDTGFDCINNDAPAAELANFLDAVENATGLPKTIIYSLNPSDDEIITSILGCFQNSDAVGKLQQGSAWWFNDCKTGMRHQMTALANGSLLGNFVGMLTDSRSFLSYPRHEYFRRIFCNLVGEWVENGEYPNDQKMLETLAKDVSYNNTVRYFGFNLDTI